MGSIQSLECGTTRGVGSEDRPPKLCRRCRKLDLDDLFNPPKGQHMPEKSQGSHGSDQSKMILYLGELSADSRCELCRFFYSMRREKPDFDGLRPEVYHVRQYFFNRDQNKDRSTRSYQGDDGSHQDRFVLFAVEHGDDKKWVPNDQYNLVATKKTDTTSWILPQASSMEFFSPTTSSTPSLEALSVLPTSINFPLLRAWIKDCEGHSGCGNRMSANSFVYRDRPAIRGIDCTTRKIVELGPDDRYLAMSYVWGNQPLQPLFKVPSGEGDLGIGYRVLPSNLPKVIEDAIIVVHELGEKYLWVDQYCIDQDDPMDKQAQIGNMEKIYEEAHTTIVAFAGRDSSFGLPGVRDTQRPPQPRFHVNHAKISLAAFKAGLTSERIQSSIWMTRGWTFQEALLSRRCLLFAEDQVYFSCAEGVWAESIMPWTRNPDINDPIAKILNQDMIKAIVPLHGNQSSSNIEDQAVEGILPLIEEYSKRDLSFQADILNAFTGLLSRLPVLTYWGVPVMEIPVFANPDDTCNPWKDITWTTAPPELQDIVTSYFLQCLYWEPNYAHTGYFYGGNFCRREGFPSWSWLGWKIPVKYNIWTFQKISTYYYEGKPTVGVEDVDGTVIPIYDLLLPFPPKVGSSTILPGKTPYLSVEGLVLKLGFQPGRPASPEYHFCFDHPLGHSASPCGKANNCDVVGFDVRVCFRLAFPSPGEHTAHGKTPLTDTWDCLFIFKADKSRYEFLILDGEGDAMCCVGTLVLMMDPQEKFEKLKADVSHSRRKIRLG